MDTPTPEQLDDMISELEEQLRYCNDDTITDELIQEIKYRKNQLKNITVQNETL